MVSTLLILGGTADARALAAAVLARWPDRRVITSLAGRTVAPNLPEGEVVTGGFGGAAGLADYIAAEGVDALIDATHPFAAEISKSAAEAATIAHIPRLVLARPPWVFVQNAAVQHVRSINAAKAALETDGKRVFLAIGRQEINQFNSLKDRFFLLRFVDPPQTPPDFGQCQVLTGRPGTLEDERSILQQFAIDTLVAKNGGSDASRAKVDAALELGIRVILIDPPAPPPPPHADSVEGALVWLDGL
ncbi:cobalt-precorrin-6A reductase [Thalassospiraceae bacterium LMO-SO8]|nr:cobalt-precorrin-6A reductase [Alphaproteobacteria bacterium LMO-S08]WND77902.1 cobalt-precorrin-6A reductase [Thalassospiraceae bacterium LMO-SO8]